MSSPVAPLIPPDERAARWTTVLGHLAAAIPAGGAVVVDGTGGLSAEVADRLADTFRAAGRPCARLTDASSVGDGAGRDIETMMVADGPRWRQNPPGREWSAVVWLRTPPPEGADSSYRGDDADIVIDLHDPSWPVIRRMANGLIERNHWYVSESRAFFAARATTWDTRFGDDMPAYAAAVTQAAIPIGATVVDVGCGTGRALPALRQAVGPAGTVIGLDLTPQMLAQAHRLGRDDDAVLIVGDALRLPIGTSRVDAIFAAGLITHVPDPAVALRELARVTRPGGRLVLFHPSGRACLAARHGRVLRPDEPLAQTSLRHLAQAAGWRLDTYDDPPHRFLAIATRHPEV